MSRNWGSMAAQFHVPEAVSLGKRVLASWARNREFYSSAEERVSQSARERECTHKRESTHRGVFLLKFLSRPEYES